MAYELYAIRAGEFSNGSFWLPAIIWKYNPTTGNWDVIPPNTIPLVGNDYWGHNADGEIGVQAQGPVWMGGRAYIPAFLEYQPQPATPYRYGYLWWDRDDPSSEHGEIFFGPADEPPTSVGYWPMLFSAVEDPNNPGQYYTTGGYSHVGHWDGSSEWFINWDETDITKYWAAMETDTMTGPYDEPAINPYNGPPQPTKPYISGIYTTFMFRHNDTFYWWSVRKQSYERADGAFFNCHVLYKHNAPNLTPDTNANLKVAATVYPFDPVNRPLGGWACSNWAGLKPILWSGVYWLHKRSTMHAGTGVGAVEADDLSFAWALNTSDALVPAAQTAHYDRGTYTETRMQSLGLHLHEASNRMYALYCTAVATTFARPTLHLLRLDSFDISTGTFNWTEVRAITTDIDGEFPESDDMPYAATITANETHMFVQFADYSPHRVFRINLLTYAVDYWEEGPSGEGFYNALIMRFGEPGPIQSLFKGFGTIIGQ